MSEQVFEIVVTDPIGLHARPVGEIVKLVKASELPVSLRRAGEAAVKADSALRLLTMKVKSGETLELVIDTDDQQLAAELAQQIGELVAG